MTKKKKKIKHFHCNGQVKTKDKITKNYFTTAD